MSQVTVMAAACVVIALLLRRRRRRRMLRLKERREYASRRNVYNGDSPLKSASKRRKASQRGPHKPTEGVVIKEEPESSEDEILARLCRSGEVCVKEEVDALALKEEGEDSEEEEGGVGQYSCHECTETFAKKTYLKWHLNECHQLQAR